MKYKRYNLASFFKIDLLLWDLQMFTWVFH